MRRALGFLLCIVGLLLPHRLRVLYVELLGWIAQAFHVMVRSLLRWIVARVREQEAAHAAARSRRTAPPEDPPGG